MKDNYKDIDKLVRNALQKHEVPFNTEDWDRMDAHLQQESSGRTGLLILKVMEIALLLVFVFSIPNIVKDLSNINTDKTTIDKSENTTNIQALQGLTRDLSTTKTAIKPKQTPLQSNNTSTIKGEQKDTKSKHDMPKGTTYHEIMKGEINNDKTTNRIIAQKEESIHFQNHVNIYTASKQTNTIVNTNISTGTENITTQSIAPNQIAANAKEASIKSVTNNINLENIPISSTLIMTQLKKELPLLYVNNVTLNHNLYNNPHAIKHNLTAYGMPHLYKITSDIQNNGLTENYQTELGMSYGLGYSVELFSNWELGLGVAYNQLYYRPIGSNKEPLLYNEQAAFSRVVQKSDISLLEIPIFAQYNHVFSKKWKFFVRSGATTNLALLADYETETKNQDFSTRENKIPSNKMPPTVKDFESTDEKGILQDGDLSSNYFMSLDAGIGFQYSFNRHIGFYLHPTYRYALKKFGPNDETLHTISIQTGFQFTLH